ncbi:PAB-dependent poly(A)-specific ribonuclease subunit PAN3 [Leucoagaricus sp. SymC.cos]|nr:PAB-dependent poly(A)-specific ribonuclease subunit PAN3 [Leucoagaricus sp. SymC.cos]
MRMLRLTMWFRSTTSHPCIDAGYYDNAPYVPPYDPTGMDAWYTNPATFLRPPLNYLLYTPATPEEFVPTITPTHFIPPSHELRQLLQSQSETIRTIAPPSTTSLPDECQGYHSFAPLEPIELWLSIRHPNIVPVREAFTTKAFNDNSLVVRYGYYPNAQTLYDVHFKNTSINLPNTTTTIISMPTSTPHKQRFNTQPQPSPDPSQIIPERTLWSYIVQLASAIKKVHDLGTPVRMIDPTKILITSSNRIRIGSYEILDVLLHSTEGSLLNHPMLSSMMNNMALMQEDLTMFGRLVFSLVCMNVNAWTAPQFQKSLDWIQRWYKPEIKSVALYLISKSSHRSGDDHLLEMIRPKIQQEMEEAMLATDRLEAELSTVIYIQPLGQIRTPATAWHAENFDTDNQPPIVNHSCHPPYAAHTQQLANTSRSSVDLGTMHHQVDPEEMRRQAKLAKLADLALIELPEPPESPRPSSNFPPDFSFLRHPICLPPSPIPGEDAPAATDPSPSPFSRSHLALCATKSGDVYFYGGYGDRGTLSRYSTKANTVTFLECGGDSPGRRSDSAMTIVGSVLALHGGYQGIVCRADPSLFLLNLASREWSKITDHGYAPVNLVNHCMVAVHTTIYIYGGEKYENGCWVSNSDLWAFNLNTLRTKPTWELVKPYSSELPSLRWDSDERGILVPIANGFKFLLREPPQKCDLGTFVWTFNLKSKCWTALARIVGDGPLQPQQLVPAAVVFGDVVYVVADYTPDPDKCIIEYSIFAFKISVTLPANLQEMDAQDVVDFLAEVLESQKFHQSRNERRRILHLLRKIVKSAQIFPKRTELSGVQCDLVHPINDEGGYGLIYQGTFEGQTVCVKAVRVFDTSPRTDAKVKRLLRAQAGELVLLAHISHQNIIPLYGAYLSAEPKPKICIVSPWMENGDLVDFLKRYPNTPPIPLMCDVAAGLQFLHDMGVIHSDLKARNVLVSQSQRAMLADFGVSTVVSTNVGTTTVGDFNGTPHWMAPELLLSAEHPPPTEQSDMWGFGCICFEVEAGRIPFIEYRSQTALIFAFVKAQITPLRPKPNCAPVITSGGPLLMLAERCWNHDPSQRPTAAGALQFLAGLVVKDDRPSMDEEFAMFEAAKSGRDEVKIDYGRILSIIQKSEQPEGKSRHFAKIALPENVPVLLQLLTKQEGDADEDKWNVSTASATCLNLLAMAVQGSIAPTIIPFIEAHAKAEDWHSRKAAAMTFGSIMDGPDPSILLVNQAFPLLICMMDDTGTLVEDTSAWAISHVFNPCVQRSRPMCTCIR